VLLCVCRSVSLCDELHAGCMAGKFIRKKFLVCVVYEGFVVFLYVKSVRIVYYC
jgi:hypothetical protein